MNSKSRKSRTDSRASPAAGDPLDVIAHEHQWQLRLCDVLEKIADDLPDNVDLMLISVVLPMLRDDLATHVRDEEEGLFPLLRKRARPGDNFEEIAQALSLEHATDEGFAEEIVDQLELLQSGRRPENPDMLGYMLRGFFETQRRHLVWEEAVVLPLARQRLTADDLRHLSRVMLDNRKGRRVHIVRGQATLFEFKE